MGQENYKFFNADTVCIFMCVKESLLLVGEWIYRYLICLSSPGLWIYGLWLSRKIGRQYGLYIDVSFYKARCRRDSCDHQYLSLLHPTVTRAGEFIYSLILHISCINTWFASSVIQNEIPYCFDFHRYFLQCRMSLRLTIRFCFILCILFTKILEEWHLG